MDDKQRYQDGMAVRRKVLGDAHVDRTLQHLTPLNDEFQDFITRYAWGETWTRPGLDHHTRQHDHYCHADRSQSRGGAEDASTRVV